MAKRDVKFQTIRSEGGLLPPDFLSRLVDSSGQVPGVDPAAYGLPAGERLTEAIAQSWTRLGRHWAEFRKAREELSEGDAATGLTNDKWSLPLLRELGFGFLPTTVGPVIEGKTYAISRFAGPTPIHLVGCGVSLDKRSEGVRGAARSNPHGLVQEFLNRSPDHLWAIVSNGLRFRILRDNQALSRQAYLEFDLEALCDGEVYSDLVVLWLLAHATRFLPRENGRPDSCWLEVWTKEAEKQGTRALTDLRGGVEKALQILGQGFVGHPKNDALRDKLRRGELKLEDFHGQLLRVVYRLIFLFVAEDRELDGESLIHPCDDSEAARLARQHYAIHYSARRLRDLALQIKGSRHSDLWRQFQLLVGALSGDGDFAAARESLALPILGSFLWSPAATAALNAIATTDNHNGGTELVNADFLEAIRNLAFTRQGTVLRPVDYKNLGSEELGGVYESLLALTPQISGDGAKFTFAEFAGNERKTSGSYYTPDSLVQCLLDSALDPVVEEAIKGKNAIEAERAILTLKVCDPAVGSGHFLIGAAHRLARHLARVRALGQGESEPSPLLYQHALRDVIGRCLYGVDVNPMAAELCRVSLWLEAIEPGKPLSFLDHHIRVGNSLLGVSPELIAAGLPDDAFTAIEGDDKKVCAGLKKLNKQEREGQRDMAHLMVAEPKAEYNSIEAHVRGIDEVPDDTIDEIQLKAEQFRRLVVSPEYQHAQQVADTWCAAFVWKKQVSAAFEAVTTDTIRRLEADPKALTPDQRNEVERLSHQYQFFHWHLAFPEVFANGGFDCVLGNPPWELTQLQEKEWFAERRPEIANARTGALRKRLIETLKQDAPTLYAAFVKTLRAHDGVSHFLGNSGRYPLCGRGRINLYAVFAEGMRSLLNESGRIGSVLPTGIATDDTTKFFFQEVVEKKCLVSLFDFENKEGLFPSVHAEQKFCLFTSGRGRRPTAPVAEFVFFAHAVEDLRDSERCLQLSAEDIALINPNTRTCPILRSRRDAELAKGIYRRVPAFIRETQGVRPEENPWGATFRQGVFNMTSDSHLFRTRAQLEADGLRLLGNIFRKDDTDYLPLYEGKLTGLDDHRLGTFEGVSKDDAAKGNERASTVVEKSTPTFCSIPRSWVLRRDVESAIQGPLPSAWLSFHGIANPNNERTFISTIVGPVAAGNSLPLLSFAQQVMPQDIACLCGNLNSFVLDYCSRLKISSRNFNFFVVKQLPVYGHLIYSEVCQWGIAPQTLRDWLLPRVLELTYSAWDLEPFARNCGWSGPPFRWDEERRFLLRCELDAVFFHLYLPATPEGKWKRALVSEGAAHDESEEDLARLKTIFPTPRDAVAYIMDAFPIARRRDEEKFNGDYRTKRIILEIYDAMHESIRTGQPYQTRLNPPPADPRCCHPARDGTLAPGSSRQLSDLMMDPLPRKPFPFQPPAELKARMKSAFWMCHILQATDPLPEQDAWVVIRHSDLMKTGTPCGIALGQFRYQRQIDARTGEAFVHVMLRGGQPPAELNIPEAEWTRFRPLAVIQEE